MNQLIAPSREADESRTRIVRAGFETMRMELGAEVVRVSDRLCAVARRRVMDQASGRPFHQRGHHLSMLGARQVLPAFDRMSDRHVLRGRSHAAAAERVSR